jgi:type IV pilus assembly protein PilA
MLRRQSGFTLVEMLIAVAVVGVLAAMAYTAYQDHTRRAYLAEAVGYAAGAKTAVEDYYGAYGRWPASNGAAGLAEAGAYRGEAVKALTVVVASENSTIELTLNDKVQDNAKAWLTPKILPDGRIRWNCSADSTIQRLMPGNCADN